MWNDIVATAVGIALSVTGAVSHSASQLTDRLGNFLMPVSATSITYVRLPDRPQPIEGNILGESTTTPHASAQSTVITQPVIQRVIETVRTTEAGANTAYIDARIAVLSQSLLAQIGALGATSHASDQNIYRSVGMVAEDARDEPLTDADLPDSLTASNYLPLSGGTLTGDLSLSGTLTAGALAVSGVSSGGAIEAPYFTATTSSATSTFTGGLLAQGAFQFSNSGNFFGLTSFGATGTTTIAANGTISTPSIIATSATSTNLFAANLAASAASFGATATSSFSSTGALSMGGNLTFGTDNTFDIGASGANRARHLYVGTNIAAGGLVTGGSVSAVGAGAFYWQTAGGAAVTIMRSPSSGVIGLYDSAETSFGRLQLGGTTSAFPSIKRNGAGLDFRLADDSGYATTTAQGGIFNGFVGVGTVSPQQALHVFSAASYQGIFVNGNGAPNISFAQFGTTPLWKAGVSGTDGNAFSISKGTANDDKLLIDTNGNLGLGQTSPTYKLDVSGLGHFTGLVDAANFVATSTTATTTLAGGLTVDSTDFVVDPDAGRVGIGTASPGTKLEIQTSAASDGVKLIRSGGERSAWLVDEGAGAGSLYLFDGSDSNSVFITGSGSSFLNGGSFGIASTTPWAKLSVTNTGTGPSFVVEDSTSPDTTPFIIDASGNVGVGIVDTTFSGAVATKLAISQTDANTGLVVGNATTPRFALNGNSDGSWTMYDYGAGSFTAGITQKSGLVGIGTASPGGLLHTYGSGDAAFRSQSTADGNNNAGLFAIGGASNANWYVGTNRTDLFGAGDSFGFYKVAGTSGTKLVITDSGNVGIGTTSPSASLAVGGNVFISSHSAVLTVDGGTFGGAPRIDLVREAQNTWSLNHLSNDFSISSSYLNTTPFYIQNGTPTGTLRLNNSGSVGVATTTPWRTLSVTGTVGFDGLTGATGAGSLCLDSNKQVVYNSASDNCLSSTRATKHDINPLVVDALSQVLALQPVSFVYNDGDGRTRFGFIAEDTANVDAHLATYDASGIVSGIDDRSIIAILVGAMKDMWGKLAALMQSDERQNDEIERLKARVDQLETAAGAPIRDTAEAPADTPASSEENDSGDAGNATPPILQSGDDTLPHADEPVENPASSAETAEPAAALEPANDNSPAVELPATGTE